MAARAVRGRGPLRPARARSVPLGSATASPPAPRVPSPSCGAPRSASSCRAPGCATSARPARSPGSGPGGGGRVPTGMTSARPGVHSAAGHARGRHAARRGDCSPLGGTPVCSEGGQLRRGRRAGWPLTTDAAPRGGPARAATRTGARSDPADAGPAFPVRSTQLPLARRGTHGDSPRGATRWRSQTSLWPHLPCAPPPEGSLHTCPGPASPQVTAQQALCSPGIPECENWGLPPEAPPRAPHAPATWQRPPGGLERCGLPQTTPPWPAAQAGRPCVASFS